ncbi:uncharacterized protein LOC130256691 isoform X2 [Oenanthe melanoleuca]|uniref:uncharacterized protein LOC130256691 isoform X2 n=1 Tax=Oenanthe melanoleuca TaxID=2939378 RepID=UPI0024C1766E|nr:uncharacterized protein LOC130256691 isoform X2 [Oenanthe melanoleuca]
MEQDNRNPQPGDLIEIDRPFHQHWALYMGDGYVIHLTPEDKWEVEQEGLRVQEFIRAVKKELLVNVAGKNQWQVNNKSDKQHNPLPVEKIISHAKAYIGKEVTYRSFGSNCERFVKKLRYGEAFSEQQKAFLDAEMHCHGITNERGSPKPGDLIEIKRPLYQHWAIYVGGGYVIHVTPVGEKLPPTLASSVSLVKRRAKVKKQLLRDMIGNYKWRVNNKYDLYRKPFPVEEIIRRAEREIGKVVLYRLLYRNCEHFVTKVRYGEAVAEQVMTKLDYIHNFSAAATVTGLIGLSFVPSGALIASVCTLACVCFACNRIAHFHICAEFRKPGRDILEKSCC